MTVGLKIGFDDHDTLNKVGRRMLRLSKKMIPDLLDNIGSEVENQTRRRITKEKTAPDGTEWKSWSESYADSEHGNTNRHGPHPGQLRESGKHSLLQLDGGLLDSITYTIEGNDVLVGSNLDYAKRMNHTRQYLGLSQENVDDIEDLVIRYIDLALSPGGL